MQKARDEKPIRTIPEGAYECGTSHHDTGKEKNTHQNDLTTDGQGNGYPVNRKE